MPNMFTHANPNGMVIWKLLMFLAFFVDQLFNFTAWGIEAKGIRSWMKFARDLLQQLVEVPYFIKSSFSPLNFHSPTIGASWVGLKSI